LLLFAASGRAADNAIRVGFGEIDITPALRDDRPVWLAGYGQGRRATGVHDPLVARCLVLDDGQQQVAVVSVDLIGLQYPDTLRIRQKLADLHYVLVSSTHNHEGPDVIGIWGRNPITRGVDDEYVTWVVDRVVEMVRSAQKQMFEATASFGTAKDDNLLRDSRQPYVFDGVLRTLVFQKEGQDQPAGIVVQWNCHPEALGSKNTLITADFPWATVAALKAKYGCPVVYLTGAVGGLMAPPRGKFQNAQGATLDEGHFEFAQFYGEAVAKLANGAIDAATPITLAPLRVSAIPIAIPLQNPMYGAARSIGVLKRTARQWTGDAEKLGEVVPLLSNYQGTLGLETEVAYLRFGELHVAAIPGELYPELVYGEFQSPVDPNVDYPDAPLEKTVSDLMPGEKWMFLGLANDEIGYIIPKRQWDQLSPFAYGRSESQYGEINSCGPEIAPILMQTLENCVRGAAK
jgi:hypothetical protein